MIKLLHVTMAVTGILSAASPEAMAQSRAYDWSGAYIGVHAGYAWGRARAESSSDCPSGAVRAGYYCDASLPALLPNAAVVGAQGTGSLSSSGFAGGAQAGFNWQSGQLVLGAEADFGAFHLGASRTGSALYPALGAGTSFNLSSSMDTDWLLTARARAGWAISDALVFVTAGVAVTDLQLSNSFRDNTSIVVGTDASGSASTSKLRAGYTVGGGVEWALTRNWTVKGEYLFVDFGDVRVTSRVTNPSGIFAGTSNQVTTAVDLTAQIARLGLNYKF